MEHVAHQFRALLNIYDTVGDYLTSIFVNSEACCPDNEGRTSKLANYTQVTGVSQ